MKAPNKTVLSHNSSGKGSYLKSKLSTLSTINKNIILTRILCPFLFIRSSIFIKHLPYCLVKMSTMAVHKFSARTFCSEFNADISNIMKVAWILSQYHARDKQDKETNNIPILPWGSVVLQIFRAEISVIHSRNQTHQIHTSSTL